MLTGIRGRFSLGTRIRLGYCFTSGAKWRIQSVAMVTQRGRLNSGQLMVLLEVFEEILGVGIVVRVFVVSIVFILVFAILIGQIGVCGPLLRV